MFCYTWEDIWNSKKHKTKKEYDMENKITLEVTEEGYTTTLKLDGREYKEVWKISSMGASRVEGDFEKEADIPEDLYYALNGLDGYEAMNQLDNLQYI